MPTSHRLNIAVTDRNPHVREFLCRELTELGHGSTPLAGAVELLESLSGQRAPQVLILDPEAAGSRLSEIAKRLKHGDCKVIVVLHVFPDSDPVPGFEGALVVEKQPNMGALKTALATLAAQNQRLNETKGETGQYEMQEKA